MNKRRQFLKFGIGLPIGLSFLFNPLFSIVRWVFAKDPKGAPVTGSDKGNVPVQDRRGPHINDRGLTDLRNFQTMGTTDHEVDLDKWRLEVSGLSKTILTFTYPQILALPSIKKKVSLVCPGFFVNIGLWRGVSIKELMGNTAIDEDINRVVISGPEKRFPKRETFTLEEIFSDKVFLAYEVNGETLPKKNGFPLRVVAEGHPGDDWVKYVYKINFEKQ